MALTKLCSLHEIINKIYWMSDKQESPIKEGEMTSGDEEIETEF